jgi:hypothetical protein
LQCAIRERFDVQSHVGAERVQNRHV